MAKLLKLRRGTTTQHGSFTGAEGEVTIDTTKDTAVVHDGSQAGGRPLAREDMSNVSSASIAGRLSNDSIATSKIAAGALPSDVTVASANIVDGSIVAGDIGTDQINNTHIADNAIQRPMIADNAVNASKIADSSITSNKILDGAIVNADVNASAAISGTKISPDFGSQNITTTGNVGIGTGSGTSTPLHVVGSGNTTVLKVESTDDDANVGPIIELFRNSSSPADNDQIGRLDFRADDASGNESTFARIGVTALDVTNATEDAKIEFTAVANDTFTPSFSITGAGVDVTGNITVSGTVDGVDIAGIGVAGGVIASATTATTQSASDNSTKVATTAYVETAVSNLVDSAPGALNTLNELAAAMGDDANFSTTVTNSIATKMPLSGGAFTGNVTIGGNITWGDSNSAIFGAGNDLNIYHNGTDSIIDNNTNNLEIVTQNSMLFKIADAESAIICNKHGSVDLYHDNSKKFETMSNGSQITGRVYSTDGYFGLDATDSMQFVNNSRIDFYVNDSNEFRMEADGDFHADGDVIAFSTTIASDERLKENIEVVPDALDKVEALRGVSFDWKRDGKSSAGVIAQEVMGVLPEAVKEVQGLNDNESHLSVNYHALTSILIESIKELSARVKELEAK